VEEISPVTSRSPADACSPQKKKKKKKKRGKAGDGRAGVREGKAGGRGHSMLAGAADAPPRQAGVRMHGERQEKGEGSKKQEKCAVCVCRAQSVPEELTRGVRGGSG